MALLLGIRFGSLLVNVDSKARYLASHQSYGHALLKNTNVRLPLQPKKKKNISHDVFGTTYGRIHMQKQDLSKLQTRKMKGLRKRRAEKSAQDGGISPKKAKSA